MNNYLSRRGGSTLTCSDEDLDADVVTSSITLSCLAGASCEMSIAPGGAITVTINGNPISWGTFIGGPSPDQDITLLADFGLGGLLHPETDDLDCQESYSSPPCTFVSTSGLNAGMTISCGAYGGGVTMKFPGQKIVTIGGTRIQLSCTKTHCSATDLF